MAQRMVRFSDLTNKIIEDDDAVVRIVVEQHPALQNGPVEIEATPDEVEPVRTSALSVVSLKLYQGDGSGPETITMEIEAFNKLAGDMDMADVIRRAQPAYPPRKQTKPAATSQRMDYSTLEYAGTPHRGKITDAEKDTVRNNLTAVNERLQRDGMRTVDPANTEHAQRYGLDTPAAEANT